MALSAKLFGASSASEVAVAQRELRGAVSELLGDPVGIALRRSPCAVVVSKERLSGYLKQLVRYAGADGDVPAYLLIPDSDVRGGVVVYHQHNGEWHLGKSEVVGDAGDQWQAFGPALAQRGVAVLAPDALAFEDRRGHVTETTRDPDDAANHLWEMTSRMVAGRLLMTDVLIDAATALGVLRSRRLVDDRKVGVAGHSFGGHVALFHAALDERVSFACVSGAAGSYANRLARRAGIGLEQAIPGVLNLTDLDGLAALVAPRPLHLISATNDPYSHDADQIEDTVLSVYRALGADAELTHLRVEGEHRLDRERSTNFADWLIAQVQD